MKELGKSSKISSKIAVKKVEDEYGSMLEMGFVCLEEIEDIDEKSFEFDENTTSTMADDDDRRSCQKRSKQSISKSKKSILEEVQVYDSEAWSQYQLSKIVIAGLLRANFTSPTPIQERVLGSIVSNPFRDLLVCAPTGTGKTLSFAIPILDYIARSVNTSQNSLCALIIVPIRELAIQISKVFEMVGHFLALRLAVIVGGMSKDKQKRLLFQDPHILVATPGRLGEFLEIDEAFASVYFKNLKFLVFDEADRLFEVGHYDEVDVIINAIKLHCENPARSTYLFSATLSSKIWQVPKKRKKSDVSLIEKVPCNDKNPLRISLNDNAENQLATGLEHYHIPVQADDKDALLFGILRKFKSKRTLIFVNSIDHIRRIVALLLELGINCLGMHAKMIQRQRLKKLDRFKSGFAQDPLHPTVMVSSDVSARGLDIDGVELIIHYHISKCPHVYIHRCGRTARGNNSGTSIAMVSPHEQNLWSSIEKITNSVPIYSPIPDYTGLLRNIVRTACSISKTKLSEQRSCHDTRWEEHAAEVLGVDLNDAQSRKNCSKSNLFEGDYSFKDKKLMTKSQIKFLRKDLVELLSKLEK